MSESTSASLTPLAEANPVPMVVEAHPPPIPATEAGHAHHGFRFAALNESHNYGYPAIEWIHGQRPQLILNVADYAQRNLEALSANPTFATTEPRADYQQWAVDIAYRSNGTVTPTATDTLAKAMTVATNESLLGAFPRSLSFFNHQTFWSTIALMLLAVVLLVTHRRKADQVKPANRVQHILEAVVLYVRDELVRPNIHHHADRWTPFLASLFLAILACNLFGLVPLFGTATSGIFMTASWAIIVFVLMLFHGIANNGPGFFLKLTPVHWSWNPMDMFVYVLLLFLEWLSLFIKPAVLAIRLFANMLAGHTVLLVFLSLGFIVHASNPDNHFMTLGLGLLGWLVAIAFYFLEVLVALVQAYVFVMLSAVFIGSCIQPEH